LAWAGNSKADHNASRHRLINQQRIQELKERVADLRDRLKDHKQHQHGGSGTTTTSLEGLQAKVTALETSVQALINTNTTLLNTITALQNENLPTRVATLETTKPSGGIPGLENYVEIKTGSMDGVNGPHLIFKGVNVHVRSNSGATVDSTGLGNLIIGYNENATGGVALNRLGSHNLVGGQMNSFSSSGGFVFGSNNTVSGRFATVFGGERNVASGLNSSILGGGQNTASGPYSTVYGGQQNMSSANYDVKPQMQSGGGTPPPPAF
jgi:hypothetical protein